MTKVFTFFRAIADGKRFTGNKFTGTREEFLEIYGHTIDEEELDKLINDASTVKIKDWTILRR